MVLTVSGEFIIILILVFSYFVRYVYYVYTMSI